MNLRLQIKLVSKLALCGNVSLKGIRCWLQVKNPAVKLGAGKGEAPRAAIEREASSAKGGV